jgi:hypothetical protein
MKHKMGTGLPPSGSPVNPQRSNRKLKLAVNRALLLSIRRSIRHSFLR